MRAKRCSRGNQGAGLIRRSSSREAQLRAMAFKRCWQASVFRIIPAGFPVPLDSSVVAWVMSPLAAEAVTVIRQTGE